MYSAVLMAALAAGASNPAWGGRSLGCQGGLVVHGAGCCGGYGACWSEYAAWGGGGCAGSCYGCMGCYGESACWGGCYGCMGCYGVYDGAGCYGGYAQPYPSYPASSYPTPNYGTPSYGMPSGMPSNPMMSPAIPNAAPNVTTPPAGAPMGDKPASPGAAKLLIDVPADATLFVDDQPVRATAGRNAFATPTLDAGQAYYYTVRVDATRDGKPVSESRRVVVRAGETVRETFNDATIATASAR